MRLDALEALEQGSKGRGLVRTPPDPRTEKTHRALDVLDWIHDVTTQIPDPGRHRVRYFGAYSCRGHIAPRPTPPPEPATHATPASTDPGPSEPSPHASPARRASWARLLKRIFEVDPLLCPCGATMEVVSVITDPDVIDRILRHLRDRPVPEGELARAPPP